jgi:hypothetical protein
MAFPGLLVFFHRILSEEKVVLFSQQNPYFSALSLTEVLASCGKELLRDLCHDE